MITKSNGEYKFRSDKYRSLNYNSSGIYYRYRAKNIGEIKYSLEYKDKKGSNHFDVWYLDSIQDIGSRNRIHK
jgi:hypothetical protein